MTPEPVAFPDVEALLVGWIPTAIPGVPAFTRIPHPRPERFVRVFRTGGPRTGLVIDQAQVTLECWDTNSVAAAQMARTLRAHVGALTGARIDGQQIYRVEEFAGPANLPDPTTGQARYTWTVLLRLRGHAI